MTPRIASLPVGESSFLDRWFEAMADPPHNRQLLDVAICRDLGTEAFSPTGTAPPAILGPASVHRYSAINSGRVGRQPLLSVLTWSRKVLDADKRAPSPWRGPGRNAYSKGNNDGAQWLKASFPDAVRVSRSGMITIDDLTRWNRLVGGTGEPRKGTISVDGYPVPFSPNRAADLVEGHLARANQREASSALTAAQLHLGLLLAHPFRDGNGRTARLAASTVLLRDGTGTSLQTCVEQHYHYEPRQYAETMGRLRRGATDADAVIDGFLGAMAGRCVLAAWVRSRHHALLRTAESADIDDPVAVVRAFELGTSTVPKAFRCRVSIEPWHQLRRHLQPTIARELRSQLGRVAGDG